ncbi:MAG: hypothetical protein P4L53_14450 [Candidatus Obscuribacterales bacterium]|nr:hypothetical protein [Candidatus Obscuribacterales bacterium]
MFGNRILSVPIARIAELLPKSQNPTSERQSLLAGDEREAYNTMCRNLMERIVETAMLLGKAEPKASDDMGLRSAPILLTMQAQWLMTQSMAQCLWPDRGYALKRVNQTIEHINSVRTRIGARHILYYSCFSTASLKRRTPSDEGK